jgi:hypothetical protein
MNNGAVKPMVVASAIGKYVRPKNNDVIDAAKNAGRISCTTILLVLTRLLIRSRRQRKKIQSVKLIPRKYPHTNCSECTSVVKTLQIVSTIEISSIAAIKYNIPDNFYPVFSLGIIVPSGTIK